MEKHTVHIVPSIYLANYLNEFESVIQNYCVTLKTFKKGEFLTRYGVVNNTAYFVKEGIFHLSLGHDQGKKSLCLFEPGTIFPVGVEIHEYRGNRKIAARRSGGRYVFNFSVVYQSEKLEFVCKVH